MNKQTNKWQLWTTLFFAARPLSFQLAFSCDDGSGKSNGCWFISGVLVEWWRSVVGPKSSMMVMVTSCSSSKNLCLCRPFSCSRSRSAAAAEEDSDMTPVHNSMSVFQGFLTIHVSCLTQEKKRKWCKGERKDQDLAYVEQSHCTPLQLLQCSRQPAL